MRKTKFRNRFSKSQLQKDEIIFVGRSNVGKSSLIRLLTGVKIRIGKRPGTTVFLFRLEFDRLDIVDKPGFGFMEKKTKHIQEKIKDSIIWYIEKNKEKVLFAIEVLDAKLFLEIMQRWEERGEIPIDIEFFNFLSELELDPIVAVNKIDKISVNKRSFILDQVCEKLGFSSPWKQWKDVVVPISAKTGEGFQYLWRNIFNRLKKRGKSNLIEYFRKTPYM